jgi:hypothetical protein
VELTLDILAEAVLLCHAQSHMQMINTFVCHSKLTVLRILELADLHLGFASVSPGPLWAYISGLWYVPPIYRGDSA